MNDQQRIISKSGTDERSGPKSPPLFVIGLQKSGTTLLNRLLIQQNTLFYSPFKLEGRTFWGDDPPFTPTAIPCGALYQLHKGLHGHALGSDDYRREDQTVLLKRMFEASQLAPILINKNPYNSVRIPWLKTMFPDCKIVAIIRHPLANVFSLLKKHTPHKNRGLGPESGWWGVKPKGWQNMLDDNLLAQISNQYTAVNNNMLNQREHIDLLVDYSDLCAYPETVITKVAQLYGVELYPEINPMENRNHEYKEGGRLLSLNREYTSETGEFSVTNNTIPKELKKFSWLERFLIWRSTRHTWNRGKQLIRTNLNK